MKQQILRTPRRTIAHAAVFGALALLFTAALPTQTQNAVANGDTRTIHLYHTHTGESISATFRVDGQYDRAALKKLNWFLRDWRTDEPTEMNPRLFDVVWETYRETGSRQPVHIVSAYRSPKTNAMLRRRSRGVAEQSQHMLGKAMDMHYVDVPMSKVREVAMRLQRGGVGYYPTSGTPFVHLDVGSVRAWPRMSYDQLARLFPDGKTVHLPTNGQPLARYEEARAEIEARGGAPVMVAQADLSRGSGKGFFERLFGAREEDEDPAAAAPPRGRTRVARVTTTDKDDGPEIQTPSERRAADQLARARRDLPRGETTIGAPAPSVAPVQVAAIAVTPPLMPMPPRRPVELAAVPAAQPEPAASVPLPPVRPSALVAVASAEKAPVLPDVIVRQSEAQTPANVPASVMAYAASQESGQALRGALLPGIAQGTVQQRNSVAPRRTQLYAAKLDSTNFALMTQPEALATVMSQKDLGIRPGLRASVKAEGRAFALSAGAIAPLHIGAMVADLRTDRFTGPAVRPIQTAGLAMDGEGRVGLMALMR